MLIGRWGPRHKAAYSRVHGTSASYQWYLLPKVPPTLRTCTQTDRIVVPKHHMIYEGLPKRCLHRRCWQHGRSAFARFTCAAALPHVPDTPTTPPHNRWFGLRHRSQPIYKCCMPFLSIMRGDAHCQLLHKTQSNRCIDFRARMRFAYIKDAGDCDIEL